jgi:hypothetical protein
VERCVVRRGGPALAQAGRAAGQQAAVEVGPALRRLLEADVDEQRTTPLSLLRSAVRYPTEVLREAGVEPAARDAFAQERFPDDPYDLSPATLADIDESLAEVGLAWGAAKAWAHKQRHGARPGTGEPSGPPERRVVAYVPDLMDRSRLSAAVPNVSFVPAAAALADAAAGADVVIVDLSRPGVLDALPANVRTVGFGSHVDTALLDAARAAGCDVVVARSKFFADPRRYTS